LSLNTRWENTPWIETLERLRSLLARSASLLGICDGSRRSVGRPFDRAGEEYANILHGIYAWFPGDIRPELRLLEETIDVAQGLASKEGWTGASI
jgi:hypothetical protein